MVVKNIFNIIPIYIGGYLYSYHKRIDFKDIIVSIMFATALAPVISEISFSNILPDKIGILMGIGIGIFIGFINILFFIFLMFRRGRSPLGRTIEATDFIVPFGYS